MNIEELEKMARAATPGPWRWDNADEGRNEIYAPDRWLFKEGFNPMAGDPSGADFSTDDWRFIAAVNPETVLKLIAAAKATRKILAGHYNYGEVTPKDFAAADKALRALDDG